jgi:hypothetical protein
VTAERLMKEIEAAARGDRRERLVAGGAEGYADPDLFAAVDEVLRRARERGERAILLPELLHDDDEWRLDTGVRFTSHRPVIGPLLVLVKRRVMLPLTRWLFEYNRDNFRRQQRVNRLLAACIEELALENARLRRDLNRR